MTPDEKQQQLRERIAIQRTSPASWGGRIADDDGEPDPDALAALDAYVEFVRLRAVAETLHPLREMGLITQARLDDAQAALDALLMEDA